MSAGSNELKLLVVIKHNNPLGVPIPSRPLSKPLKVYACFPLSSVLLLSNKASISSKTNIVFLFKLRSNDLNVESVNFEPTAGVIIAISYPI